MNGPWSPAGARPLRVGRWLVDPAADELHADGQTVKLEPQRMRLLLVLAERPGEVVLAAELLDRVWTDVVVTPGSLYQGVAQLRRALASTGDATPYIETVPRKGYRLVAPVEVVARASAARAVVAPEPPAAPEAPPRRRALLGAAALATAGCGMLAMLGRERWLPLRLQPASDRLRIAVLPFEAGGDAALGEGLAFDVVRALERLVGVDVIGCESAQAVAAGRPLAALAADAWVTGTLERRGDVLSLQWKLTPQRGGGRWQQQHTAAAQTLAGWAPRLAGELAGALGLVAGPSAPARDSEAYELNLRAEAARRAGTPGAAAEYFRRAAELDAADARSRVGLARLQLDAARAAADDGARAAALAAAQSLAAQASMLAANGIDDGDAQLVEGERLLQVRDWPAAQLRFAAVARQRPGSAAAQRSFGIAAYEEGRPERALPALRRATALDPLVLPPIGWLGAASVAAGRLDEAEAAFRRETELAPRYGNGWWGLGLVAYARGALDDAVRAYREALKHEPDRGVMWSDLAWWLLDLGLPGAAAEAYERSVALLPQARWPRFDAAYAWVAAGAPGEVPAELDATPAAWPEDVYPIDILLLRLMAGLPVQVPQVEAALEVLRGRGITPRQAPWHLFMGHDSLLDLAAVWHALGQETRAALLVDEAEAQLDECAAHGQRWHAAAFHRSRIAALRGDAQRALAALELAVAAGSRRAWWLRRDPAFAALHAMPRFEAVLAAIEHETAPRRVRLARA